MAKRLVLDGGQVYSMTELQYRDLLLNRGRGKPFPMPGRQIGQIAFDTDGATARVFQTAFDALPPTGKESLAETAEDLLGSSKTRRTP